MTDEPLRMKIRTMGGKEFEIPARQCEYCDGTGILGRPMTYNFRGADSDEFETAELKPGDRCRPCCGRGMVGTGAGPLTPVKPKPSEIN